MLEEKKESLKDEMLLDNNGVQIPKETPPEKTDAEKEEERQQQEAQQQQVNKEPTVEELKAQLKKSEEDKENYKQGMLTSKKKLKSLEIEEERQVGSEEEEEEQQQEEQQTWDESSQKFQDETITKAGEAAAEAAKKILESTNETDAINEFVNDNPELVDDANWGLVVSNYVSKHGKGSIINIKKDLSRALLLAKDESPELTALFEKRNEVGANDAQQKAKDLNAIANTGNKKVQQEQQSNLSDDSVFMAKKMKTPIEELEKETDSQSAEIELV